MAKAEVYTHSLRMERTSEYRDGEIVDPVVGLSNLKVGVFADSEGNVIIAPDWEKLGVRPFLMTLSVEEAKLMRDRLNKLLDSK